MNGDVAATLEAFWQHPAFERVVELLSWATTDDGCDAELGEIAAQIIQAIERPGTSVSRPIFGDGEVQS